MARARSFVLLLCSLTAAYAEESDFGERADGAHPQVVQGAGGGAPPAASGEERSSSEPGGGQTRRNVGTAPDAGVARTDAGTVSAPGGGSAARDAAVAVVESFDCVVTRSRPSRGRMMNISWRVTWDAHARVKSQHATAATDSPVKFAWRYGADGREVAYAGFGPGMYDNFQLDTKYDEHGNVKDFYLSYPAHPNLQVPSTAPVSIGTSYVNEYNAVGQLTASTATPYGPGNVQDVTRSTFRHDAEGRCQRIEVSGGFGDSSETRSYDAAGRLLTGEIEPSRPVDPNISVGPNISCEARVTTRDYDAVGRITRMTSRCCDSTGARS